MPVINCPIPACEYYTDDTEAILAAAQLNIHALTHQPGTAAAASTKQRPPKIDRPSVSRGSTEEEWNTFLKRWNIFKRGTAIPIGQLTTQLWQCCDKDLEDDLFKDVDDVSTIDEIQLLAAIKRLSVVSTAASVRKTELLSLQQDHGQPIRYAAKVKGKAQVCAFTKQCPNTGCARNVDYTEDIVKYVVISGIADEEIKKDVLGYSDLDKSLNETISLIENKEMATRAMSSSLSTSLTLELNMAANTSKPKPFHDKLTIKAKCKSCHKQIQKFKIRRGKLKEFTECIECWKSRNQDNTTGALFDTLGSISTDSNEAHSRKKSTTHQNKKSTALDHHIFDGTYGWMVKESKKQPSIRLRISTNKVDYAHLNAPCPQIKSSKILAITDTRGTVIINGI